MRWLVLSLALLVSPANAVTPPTVTANPVSATEIDLSWTAAVPDSGESITGYWVLRNGSVIATLGSSASTYQDTNLSPATSYQYSVQVIEQATATSPVVTAMTQPGSTPPPGTIPATASRPNYNIGNGFYVVGRGIYDANGNLFTPIGANKQHYDSSAPTRFQAKPNAERLMPFFNQPWSVNKPLMDEDVSNKVVPIPAVFYTNYNTGVETTGKTDLATLNAAVNFWVTQRANWTQYNNIAMFNIANEWGPCSDDSDVANYQNGYVSAVKTMRNAGYTAPLVVDASCSGQGADSLLASAAAIEAADPLHNTVFSIHVYGSFYWQTPFCNGCGFQFTPTMQQLAALNVPVIIGEFGCANCDFTQPSPVPVDEIMKAGELYQFGWLAWSWDDNSCTYNLLGPCPPGQGYLWTFQLSDYGKDVITSPGFGMQAVSKPATIFQ